MPTAQLFQQGARLVDELLLEASRADATLQDFDIEEFAKNHASLLEFEPYAEASQTDASPPDIDLNEEEVSYTPAIAADSAEDFTPAEFTEKAQHWAAELVRKDGGQLHKRRALAVSQLQRLAVRQPGIVATVLEPILCHHDWRIRQASWNVMKAAPPDQQVWKTFRRCVVFSGQGVRRDALLALPQLQLGEVSGVLICELLLASMRDSCPEVCRVAMQTAWLIQLTPADEEGARLMDEILLDALGCGDADMCVQAADNLGCYGQAAMLYDHDVAATALGSLLLHQPSSFAEEQSCPGRPAVQRAVASALRQMAGAGSPTAMSMLKDSLKSKDPELRLRAILGHAEFEHFHAGDASSRAFLRKYGKDKDAFIRDGCCALVGDATPQQKGALSQPMCEELSAALCRAAPGPEGWRPHIAKAEQGDFDQTDLAAAQFKTVTGKDKCKNVLLRALRGTAEANGDDQGQQASTDYCSPAELLVAQRLCEIMEDPYLAATRTAKGHSASAPRGYGSEASAAALPRWQQRMSQRRQGGGTTDDSSAGAPAFYDKEMQAAIDEGLLLHPSAE
eukprot:TRINITY_DN56920_c0_g1_i1.p1 TRINITY_DN56920_c0_g1~~TRINITY_DN56920_c0_g1_i1.p1  ORF type:complete len:583 (+),score=123.06 TRINITY_DN56920_c0_g1_i1:57-1751(+)